MPQGGPKMPPGGPLGTQNRPQSPKMFPRGFPDPPDHPPAPSALHFCCKKDQNTGAEYSRNTITPKHLVKCMVLRTFERRPTRFLGTIKWPQEAPWSPPRDPMTPPRRPQDVSHAHQNVSLRLPRGPRRPETFQDAANTYGDIPNETRFPSLASQVSSAAPKSVKKPWFLQGFWLFGPSKKCKKGGGPKMGPKRPPRRFLGPQKWPQEAPKSPPGGAQDAPRRPQEGPKRALGGPEPPPGAPKTPPRRPQKPPDRSPAPSKLHFLKQNCPKHENVKNRCKNIGF